MKTENNRLREALVKARAAICHFARYQCDSLKWENSNIQSNCGDVLCSWRCLCEAKTDINAVLSEPVRNYEVGTPEEQCRRWRRFCDAIDECEKCPCQKSSDEISADCFARWAQMTYDKESAGE